jgi:hypothetical protein
MNQAHALPEHRGASAAGEAALLQRKCACGQHTPGGGECEECRKKRTGTLQRSAVRPSAMEEAPPIVHEVLRSPGQPLDPAAREALEPRFGRDFSQVRVHSDGRAAESARAVDALAYTVGPQIVFAGGRYEPGRGAGLKLLAHELTHVVQQEGRDTSGPLRVGPAGDAFEQEADRMAEGAGPLHFGSAAAGVQRLGQDFSRVPLRSGQALQRKKASQNPGLGALSSLSTQAKLQRCEELLKGITTKQEEEALLDLLTTLPFAERGKLVAKHGRKRFLRNFSFERRREAEAITLTDADLQDPEILAWLKSLRKPERYFKYNLHPAVWDHLEKLVRLREISTPLEAQNVELSGIKDDVKLTVNGIEVTVKRDVKGARMWKKGSTMTNLFAVPTPGNGLPGVRIETQTSYGERAHPEDESDYGRGTTKEDEEAGKTSVRFHEGHHGMDAQDYLQQVPLPQPNWRSGMTDADYQKELNRYQGELNKYEKDMADYTELKTDCPGTPHNAARCAVLRAKVPKHLQ